MTFKIQKIPVIYGLLLLIMGFIIARISLNAETMTLENNSTLAAYKPIKSLGFYSLLLIVMGMLLIFSGLFDRIYGLIALLIGCVFIGVFMSSDKPPNVTKDNMQYITDVELNAVSGSRYYAGINGVYAIKLGMAKMSKTMLDMRLSALKNINNPKIAIENMNKNFTKKTEYSISDFEVKFGCR